MLLHTLFHPQLTRFASLMLLARVVTCYEIFCDELPFHGPTLFSDCEHIIAHMPLFQALDTQDLADADAKVSPSIPFFPQMALVHGACHIQLDIHGWEVLAVSQCPSRKDLFQAWIQIRDGAARVVRECVRRRCGGYEVGEIVPNSDFGYYVEVSNPTVAQQELREQRQAMAYVEPPNAGYRYDGVFDIAFYIV